MIAAKPVPAANCSRGAALRDSAGGLVVLLAALLGIAACNGRAPSRDSAPDVVLVVIDALRADRLRFALDGYTSSLPNLRRLAEDAVVYERASSPATWCVPAYGSLLTGRWPSFHGAERQVRDGVSVVQPLDVDAKLLSELLRERGLRTAAFLPGRDDLGAPYGFDRGFQDFVDDPALALPSRMAEAVTHWLDRAAGPVFVLASFDPLRQAKTPGGSDGAPRAVDRSAVTTVSAAAGQLPADKRADLVAGYDADLDAVDGAVGEILAALQADGRYAGSMIVVTSDHGELLGEHGLAGHGWPPFEDLLNVPLIVKYPDGRGAGSRVDRRVSTLGVFASVLAAVGASTPADVQSRPLDDRHPVWAEDVDRKGRRVRAGYDGLRKKLIRVTSDTVDVACVYDMYKDTAELKPDCEPSNQSPLHRAMASFSKQPRPGEPAGGLARAADDKSEAPGERRSRATN